MESIFLTLIVLIMLMFVRQGIVFICRIKEIHRIHNEAIDALHAGKLYDPESMWKSFKNGPTADQQALDLTKWTYKQFYPNE
jgi:hypothetical protein